MFSAIDFVSANDMLAITATTSPRSGNVMRDVVPPMNSSLLPWPAIRVGLARKRIRLELPAKAVAGLLARGQPLRRLEQLDGAGLQQLAALGAGALAEAAVDADPEPHQVRRRGQERGGAGVGREPKDGAAPRPTLFRVWLYIAGWMRQAHLPEIMPVHQIEASSLRIALTSRRFNEFYARKPE